MCKGWHRNPSDDKFVVDDEPLIRWSLVNRLKEEGYRTVEAGTTGDAVAQHRDGVELVLLRRQGHSLQQRPGVEAVHEHP